MVMAVDEVQRPRGGLREGNIYPKEPYYVPEKDKICDYPVKVKQP